MYFSTGKHVSICVVDLLLYNIFLGCLVYFESGDIFGIEPGNWEGSALWLGSWVEPWLCQWAWVETATTHNHGKSNTDQSKAEQCIADTSRGQGLLITRDLILPMAACLSDAMGSGIIIRRLCFEFQTGER